MRPQTCKKCNRIQYVVWNVSDDLWQKFCRKTGWNESRTICLECFAEMICRSLIMRCFKSVATLGGPVLRLLKRPIGEFVISELLEVVRVESLLKEYHLGTTTSSGET